MEPRSLSREMLGKSASTYEHLKHLAIKGELRPDRRLSPVDLADYFRVSVTPIRDALVRLAAEGFITWEMSRGYFTKPFTVAEQRHLLEVGVVFLVASMERAMGHLPVELLEEFIEPEPLLIGDQQRAVFYAARFEALHSDFAAASQNDVLGSMSKAVVDRTHLTRLLDMQQPSVASDAAEAQQRIARAMLGQDLATAVRTTREALDARLQRLPALVDRANLQALQARFP